MFYSKNSILKLIKEKKVLFTPCREEYLGPASYEMHLGDKIQLVSPKSDSFDGLKPKEKNLVDINISDEGFTLEPNQFIIAKTLENIFCCEDIIAFFDGKASLAQIGLFTNISSVLVEPLTNSTITCEIYNCSGAPIVLRKGQKIGQLFFSNIS